MANKVRRPVRHERKWDCSECGQEAIRHEGYDAYYCVRCNLWLEEKCRDPSCIYCRHRPERPHE